MGKERVTAGLALVIPGHILLVHPTGYPLEGTWSIPKGHMDRGETIQETAVREVEEEVGVRVPLPFLKGAPCRVVRGQKLLYFWTIDVRDAGLPDIFPDEWLQIEEVDIARFVSVDQARILLKVDMWPVLGTVPMT